MLENMKIKAIIQFIKPILEEYLDAPILILIMNFARRRKDA